MDSEENSDYFYEEETLQQISKGVKELGKWRETEEEEEEVEVEVVAEEKENDGKDTPNLDVDEAAADDEDDIDSRSLVMKNLPYHMELEFLVKEFDRRNLPQPISMRPLLDKTGKFCGMVFMQFSSVQESLLVLENFTESHVGGREIRIERQRKKASNVDEVEQFITNKLKELRRDNSIVECAFPTKYTAEQRRKVHLMAEKSGFRSETINVTDGRQVIVSKRRRDDIRRNEHIGETMISTYMEKRNASGVSADRLPAVKVLRQPLGPDDSGGFKLKRSEPPTLNNILTDRSNNNNSVNNISRSSSGSFAPLQSSTTSSSSSMEYMPNQTSPSPSPRPKVSRTAAVQQQQQQQPVMQQALLINGQQTYFNYYPTATTIATTPTSPPNTPSIIQTLYTATQQQQQQARPTIPASSLEQQPVRQSYSGYEANMYSYTAPNPYHQQAVYQSMDGNAFMYQAMQGQVYARPTMNNPVTSNTNNNANYYMDPQGIYRTASPPIMYISSPSPTTPSSPRPYRPPNLFNPNPNSNPYYPQY